VISASSAAGGLDSATALALGIVGLVAGVIAVVFAYLAVRQAQRSARQAQAETVSDRLFDNLAQLLDVLNRIGWAVDEVRWRHGGRDCGSADDSEAGVDADGDADSATERAERAVRPLFHEYLAASARVGLARAQRRSPDAHGDWVLGVANTVAMSLRQADDSARILARRMRDPERHLGPMPDWTTTEHWSVLTASASYWTVHYAVIEAGAQPDGSLRQWWAQRVIDYAGPDSAYDVSADYLTQHTMLLADFGREYVAPWAHELVKAAG